LASESKDFFPVIFSPHPLISGVKEQIQTQICSLEDEQAKNIQKNQSCPLNSLLKLRNTAIYHKAIKS
jgi:hypothetical protein